MGASNTGTQSVYFNYHKALTGDNFGKAQQNYIRAGVLAGMAVTKTNNTTVGIASGVFAVSDGTRMVTISKAANNALTVNNTHNYVVARYTYSETEAWYADFEAVANPITNDVVLAKLNWTSTTLTSVDNTLKTDGRRVNDYELYVTANSLNGYFKDLIQSGVFGNTASGNIWLNLIDNAWFDDTSNPPLEEMLGGMIPVLGFDKGSSRYMYFMIKSGSPVDVKLKLKYVYTGTGAQGVVMKLEYMTLTDGLTNMDSLTFTNSNTETISAPGAINVLKEFSTSTLKIPSAAMTVPDKLILCRLSRAIADGGDTNTATVKFIHIVPFTS